MLLLAVLRLPRMRLAEIADASKLRWLLSDAAADDGSSQLPDPPALEWWRTQLEKPDSRFLMLENRSSGRPVGFVRLIKKSESHSLPDRRHVALFVVNQRCRRQGHGRRLLRAALEWLDADGVSCTSLFVRPSNLAALRLYRGLGFREHTRVANYYASSRRGEGESQTGDTSAKEDALLCVRWLDEQPHSPPSQQQQQEQQQQEQQQKHDRAHPASGVQRLRGGRWGGMYSAGSVVRAL